MTSLLAIVIPLLILSVMAFFYTKPANFIAGLKKQDDRSRRLLWFALLIFSTGSTLCFDLLDFSQIIFTDAERETARLSAFVKDLELVYGLSGPNLSSACERLRDIASGQASGLNENAELLLAIGLGLFAGLYILVSIYDTASEGVLAHEIRETHDQLLKAQDEARFNKDMFDSVCELMKQVRTIVLAKMHRLSDTAEGELSSEQATRRLNAFRSAMSPDSQIQAMVDCAHAFFMKRDPGTRLRVALYLLDDRGSHLFVKASTDGESHGVIRAPEKSEHKDLYRVDVEIPKTIAARAYMETNPIVISDCAKDSRFAYIEESQKAQIKSLFAFALAGGGTAKRLGVLLADVNKTGYFSPSEPFVFHLGQLGEEIALRLRLERRISHLLKCIESGVEKQKEKPE